LNRNNIVRFVHVNIGWLALSNFGYNINILLMSAAIAEEFLIIFTHNAWGRQINLIDLSRWLIAQSAASRLLLITILQRVSDYGNTMCNVVV
jgi:hypothetical protein